MNVFVFVIGCICIFLISIVLGFFVYFKGQRKKATKLLALSIFATALWILGLGLMVNASNINQAIFYLKYVHYVGAIFIPVFFLHFVIALLELEEINKKVIFFAYISSVVLLFFNFANLLATTKPTIYFNYYTTPLIFYPFFTIIFFACVVYSEYLLYREYKRTSGYKKNRLKYLFLGTIISFLGGATTFPLVFNIPLFPFGVYLVPSYAIFLTYAIIKHRLMDIDLAQRYLAIYICYGIISIILFLPLIFFLRKLGVTGTVLITSLVILAAPYIHQGMEKVLRPAFLSKYSYWKTIRGLWRRVRVLPYTTSQLGRILVLAIVDSMGLKSGSFLLFDRDKKEFVPRGQVGLEHIFGEYEEIPLKILTPDSALITYLKDKRDVIIREELEHSNDSHAYEAARVMREIEAVVSFPLFVADQLKGILNLGPKERNEVFSEEDIKVLKEFVAIGEQHFSHALFLENSLFYSGDIAHDLRKPFKGGIIYDYLEDIRQGLNDPNKKNLAQEALDDLEGRLEDIYYMTNRMVDIYESLERFLTGEVEAKRISYKRLVFRVSKPYVRIAKGRHLEFDVVLPKQRIVVYVDTQDTKRILDELITNALKYTQEGKITVKVYQRNYQEVVTEVSDTGGGIPEDEKEKIFNPFYRRKGNIRGVGSGIGLAMVRQLVEANGGRIWVESELGKGTTFLFTLPTGKDRIADKE
jgi:signal transduction histidine kinase